MFILPHGCLTPSPPHLKCPLNLLNSISLDIDNDEFYLGPVLQEKAYYQEPVFLFLDKIH